MYGAADRWLTDINSTMHLTSFLGRDFNPVSEWYYIDGLAQDCGNSSASALELSHTCADP